MSPRTTRGMTRKTRSQKSSSSSSPKISKKPVSRRKSTKKRTSATATRKKKKKNDDNDGNDKARNNSNNEKIKDKDDDLSKDTKKPSATRTQNTSTTKKSSLATPSAKAGRPKKRTKRTRTSSNTNTTDNNQTTAEKQSTTATTTTTTTKAATSTNSNKKDENQDPKLIVTLNGHSDHVRCVSFLENKDGTLFILSGSDDGSIKLWNSSSGKCVYTIHPSKTTVAVTTRTTAVATAAATTTTTSGSHATATSETSKEAETKEDKKEKAGNDKDSHSNTTTTTISHNTESDNGHCQGVLTLAILPCQTKFISGSADCTLKLWNVHTIPTTAKTTTFSSAAGATFSSLSSVLITCLKTYHGHLGYAICLMVPNVNDTLPYICNTFVSGSTDTSIKIWSLPTQDEFATATTATAATATASSPADNTAAAATATKPAPTTAPVSVAARRKRKKEKHVTTTKSHDNNDEEPHWTLVGHTEAVCDLARISETNPNEDRFISGSLDGTVKLWTLSSSLQQYHQCVCLWTYQEPLASQSPPPPPPPPSSSLVPVPPQIQKAQIYALAVVDEHQFLSASNDNTIKLWHTGKGSCVQTFKGHTNAVRSLALWRRNDDTVEKDKGNHNTTTETTATVANVSEGNSCSGSSNAGKMVMTETLSSSAVTPHTDSTASTLVDDNKNGEQQQESQQQQQQQEQTQKKSQSSSISSSLSSIYFISGSLDGTIKLWNCSRAECLYTFKGHTGDVMDVDHAICATTQKTQSCSTSFPSSSQATPSGFIASASWDNTIKLWSTAVDNPTIAGTSSPKGSIGEIPKQEQK